LGPMTVHDDSEKKWGDSNSDFDSEVWCTSCGGGKYGAN
jgi:hypothetical protein